MLNEKFRWNKSYNLSIVQISDSPLINLMPSGIDSNVYVFEESGSALHVQGSTKTILEKIKLSDHKLSTVEGAQVGDQGRFLVADTAGNLFLYDYQFKGEAINLGRKENSIHSMVDIGMERALIAYQLEKNVVIIELIEMKLGRVIASLKLEGTQRIRDMHCQDSYGESCVRIFAGTDHSVVELQVEDGKLSILGIEHLPPNEYLDEVFGEDSQSRVYLYRFVPDDPKEKMHPSSKGIWSYDPDEKLSTISFEFERTTFYNLANQQLRS